MTAVLPRLPAAKQRREVSVKIPINTSLSDRVIGDITRLAGVLPAAEAQFGEVFVQSTARCFILGQLGVAGFDVLHRLAGVPDGSPFNLVGN